MKIAVTGASGDIGGAFLAHAAPRATCHALARLGAQHDALKHPNVHHFPFDDGFTYETDFLRRFTDADAVVHFAAFLNTVVEPERELTDYVAVNAMLTGLLVALCKRPGAPQLVYISSEMVYELEDTVELQALAKRFVSFCEQAFSMPVETYDLRALAQQFIRHNATFPFTEMNIYTLTKYLGEAIARTLPTAAIVRVACAYGPEYTNQRLIPRLAAGRLTGDGATFVAEDRNFVYSSDINRLLTTVIEDRLSDTIDCRPADPINTRDLKRMIIQSTPTAYGELKELTAGKSSPAQPVKSAALDLTAIIGDPTPFEHGLAETLRIHKDKCYHQMEHAYALEDFLEPGERITKMLIGNSASYTFIVGEPDGTRKVRKIAIRQGIEGNGVAKLNSEIRYYRHVMEDPSLKPLYPDLLDCVTAPTYSTETIEYLDGLSFYAALKSGEHPYAYYKQRFANFINGICDTAIKEEQLTAVTDPQRSLDAYYIERALTRLQSIHAIIPAEPTIRINGRQLLSPHIILEELMHDPKLRSLVLPRNEHPCFHGDMTLLNAVLIDKTHEVKLVDPRGVTGNWDPLYDFAKLKFTLSGFGELIVEPGPLVSQDADGYHIGFDRIPAHVQRLHEQFFDILANDEHFSRKIIANEPHWRHRIALADAVHHLSDIPFRLFTDETDWKAISLYVLGTYYLNDVYAQLKRDTSLTT